MKQMKQMSEVRYQISDVSRLAKSVTGYKPQRLWPFHSHRASARWQPLLQESISRFNGLL